MPADLKQSTRQAKRLLQRMAKYTGVLFFLFIALVYGYVIMQINEFGNTPVDQQAVADQVQELSTPSIDEQAARKLQNLRDNSVNVQTLFEESRTNPFSE